MFREPRPTQPRRRKFLRDLATAGGLAAVAGATGVATATPAPAAKAPVEERKGYRVTTHVATYYQKARI